jgi:hypothetical protein
VGSGLGPRIEMFQTGQRALQLDSDERSYRDWAWIAGSAYLIVQLYEACVNLIRWVAQFGAVCSLFCVSKEPLHCSQYGHL